MGLDIHRLAKRAILSQTFNPVGGKWRRHGNVQKKPKRLMRSWKSPLQRYQYNVEEPEADGTDFNYDFTSPKQYFHPYSLPGYRPDFNIGINGNDSWNTTKVFGAPQDESSPSDKWTSILNKVPTPIFGTPFEKQEDINQQSKPESTWFSDVLSKII